MASPARLTPAQPSQAVPTGWKACAARAPAFTMVEALLAAALLTLVVAATVVPFSVGARHEQVAARQAVALELAQDLMEEILSRPVRDPDGSTTTLGPEAGESSGTDRTGLDNVDDYHNYTEAAGAIRPSLTGAADDALAADMGRCAQVEYVRLAGQDLAQPMNVCKVTVRVDQDGANLVTLTRLVYADVTN